MTSTSRERQHGSLVQTGTYTRQYWHLGRIPGQALNAGHKLTHLCICELLLYHCHCCTGVGEVHRSLDCSLGVLYGVEGLNLSLLSLLSLVHEGTVGLVPVGPRLLLLVGSKHVVHSTNVFIDCAQEMTSSGERWKVERKVVGGGKWGEAGQLFRSWCVPTVPGTVVDLGFYSEGNSIIPPRSL